MNTPSPEQLAIERDLLKRRQANEAIWKTCIPVVVEARAKLRELEALGLCSSRLVSAREVLALLDEDLRTALVRPVETLR